MGCICATPSPAGSLPSPVRLAPSPVHRSPPPSYKASNSIFEHPLPKEDLAKKPEPGTQPDGIAQSPGYSLPIAPHYSDKATQTSKCYSPRNRSPAYPRYYHPLLYQYNMEAYNLPLPSPYTQTLHISTGPVPSRNWDYPFHYNIYDNNGSYTRRKTEMYVKLTS